MQSAATPTTSTSHPLGHVGPVEAAGRGTWAAGRWAQVAARAVAAAGLAAALGASIWLVLAAAERPSPLSPPTMRAPAPWLLGPLSGALPHLTTDVARLHADLTIALVVLTLGWLVASVGARALPVRVVAAVVGLAQVVFLLGPPLPLTDFFNYVVYGRMAASGTNPYVHAPVAGAHDTAYALSNWHHLPSPYGPLFTLFSEPLGLVGLPVAYWAWKATAVACSLAVLAVVWWLARRLGRSPQRRAGVRRPVPGHARLRARRLPQRHARRAVHGRGGRVPAAEARTADGTPPPGALVVVAAGLKPSFAIVIPIVVLGARRRALAALGAAGAAAVVAAVVWLAFGGVLPDVATQGRLVTPMSVPNLLGLAAGHGGADAAVRAAGRDALIAVVLVASALVAWRRRWVLPLLGIVLLAGVLSLSWVMPWYLAWSLPFAALALPRASMPLAVAAALWLGVGGSPQMVSILHAAGYYPTRHATGLANHEFERRLVR